MLKSKIKFLFCSVLFNIAVSLSHPAVSCSKLIVQLINSLLGGY